MPKEEGGWWDAAERQWWHWPAVKMLSIGPLPRHIAFVMDGNRRFARTKHLSSVIEGHRMGFSQLTQILDWCYDIGIYEVTVYAFSIENFKRSSEEVDGLMRLAEEKFTTLINDSERLKAKQIRFRFFGDQRLFEPKLRSLVAKIETMTKDYNKGTVNICMPYTSTDEMARAVEKMRRGRESGLLREDQISEWLIGRCLDGGDSTSNPQLLIRTSGEKRLSDFMMYQMASTHLHFEPVLWPDFNFTHLFRAIVNYQYFNTAVQKVNDIIEPEEPTEEEMEELTPFLKFVDNQRRDQLKEWMAEQIGVSA